MRLHQSVIALSLITLLSACTSGQDKGPDARPVREPEHDKVADPMASFARMVSGEWRVTAQSGTSMFDTWHWGPGKHSSLLGRTWEAKGNWVIGDAFHIQSTFEWVPLADAIYARVLAPSKVGEPRHLLDAYFYHHTGTDALHWLALSNPGGVYEGDLTVLDGGALHLDLNGYEGDQVVPHVLRFDFEKDETLRHRDWSLTGTERSQMLDVHQKKLEPKRD